MSRDIVRSQVRLHMFPVVVFQRLPGMPRNLKKIYNFCFFFATCKKKNHLRHPFTKYYIVYNIGQKITTTYNFKGFHVLPNLISTYWFPTSMFQKILDYRMVLTQKIFTASKMMQAKYFICHQLLQLTFLS